MIEGLKQFFSKSRGFASLKIDCRAKAYFMCMWRTAEKGSTDVKILLDFSLSLIEDQRVHEWYFKILLFQVVFLFSSLIVGSLLLLDSSIRNFQHCILLCLIARLESPHCEDFLWVSPLQMFVISVTQLWTPLMAPATPYAR